MLNEALGTPCLWCGCKLTVDNIQVDHRNPVFRTIEQSKDVLEKLNRPKNLRFICRRYNLMKGTIPEKKFKKLIDFLHKDRDLRIVVTDALYYYHTRYAEYPYSILRDIP